MLYEVITHDGPADLARLMLESDPNGRNRLQRDGLEPRAAAMHQCRLAERERAAAQRAAAEVVPGAAETVVWVHGDGSLSG